MDSVTSTAVRQFSMVLQVERQARQAKSDLQYQVSSLSHEQLAEYAEATTMIQERLDAWD